MTEDINHSGEGGLYGELIQNRSMMAATSAPVAWSLITPAAGFALMSLDPGNPLNPATTAGSRSSTMRSRPPTRRSR
jgi:hypothetical protein